MDAKRPDNPTKLEVEYVEVQLDQVVRYFVNGYKFPDKDITSHEYFVDPAKGKVVLKLLVERLVEKHE